MPRVPDDLVRPRARRVSEHLVRRSPRQQLLRELPDDLVRLGEAVLGVLREDEALAVVDVEDAVRTLDEHGVDASGLLDLRGQPDRVALVASGRAVDDAD